MPPVVLAAGAGAVVVLAVLVALQWQRRRLAKRFARRVSPFTRPSVPPIQVADPEEWTSR